MEIVHKLTVHMEQRRLLPCLEMVQCDANTRVLELTLLAGGVAWEVPAGMKVAVAFRKSDGTAGLYDKLPDGTAACSFSGNVVRAILAPQVFGDLVKLGTADKSSLVAAINELVATVGNLGGETGGNNCGITYIESTDTDNPVVLRELESGAYVLKGKFLPYTGATGAISFASSFLVNIITKTAGTYVQVFYPVNNTVSFLSITDDSWERTDIQLNELGITASVDDNNVLMVVQG